MGKPSCVSLLSEEEKDKITINESHTHCNKFLGFFPYFCLMYVKTIFAKCCGFFFVCKNLGQDFFPLMR